MNARKKARKLVEKHGVNRAAQIANNYWWDSMSEKREEYWNRVHRFIRSNNQIQEDKQ